MRRRSGGGTETKSRREGKEAEGERAEETEKQG